MECPSIFLNRSTLCISWDAMRIWVWQPGASWANMARPYERSCID